MRISNPPFPSFFSGGSVGAYCIYRDVTTGYRGRRSAGVSGQDPESASSRGVTSGATSGGGTGTTTRTPGRANGGNRDKKQVTSTGITQVWLNQLLFLMRKRWFSRRTRDETLVDSWGNQEIFHKFFFREIKKGYCFESSCTGTGRIENRDSWLQ